MSLINSSPECIYCSNLVSNHVIIRLIRFVSWFTIYLCNAIYVLTIFSISYKRFTKIYILRFGSKQGLKIEELFFSFFLFPRRSSSLVHTVGVYVRSSFCSGLAVQVGCTCIYVSNVTLACQCASEFRTADEQKWTQVNDLLASLRAFIGIWFPPDLGFLYLTTCTLVKNAWAH